MCIFAVLVYTPIQQKDMKTVKKRVKTYYILLEKDENRVYIATTKSCLIDKMNVSVDTVRRNMSKEGVYNNDLFTLWSNVPIKYKRTGFAL